MSAWRVLHGDCLEVMARLRDASVDAIVTDPPYGLGFMGKKWDTPGALVERAADTTQRWDHVGGNHNPANSKDAQRTRLSEGRKFQAWSTTWATEALRVAKPGAHLLAFGGTRTFHRLAVAIEDAGWEVRDCLSWLYGCLDESSEALTRTGWKRGVDLTTADEVLQWDSETGRLSWEQPAEVIRKPYSGPMCQIKNRHTDQLLTPNHRVYAKIRRHSRHAAPDRYEVVEARDVSARSAAWQVTLPMAGVYGGTGTGPDASLAYLVGWWLTDAWKHGDGKAVMFSQAKPKTLAKLRAALAPFSPSEYVKPAKKATHNDEHTFYVAGNLASRLRADYPDRKLTWDVLDWSIQSRQALYEGLMDGDGSRPKDQHTHTFWSKDAERRDVFLALCVSLGMRAYIGEKDCVFVSGKFNTTQVQAKHRPKPVQYDGLVWCVRVPTGAFVARRNGRPFITGNSGFPKSHNLDGPHEGWGTALKPAMEPICVARKPLVGTVAKNVATFGTGALNIDGCRVEAGGERPLLEKTGRTGNVYGAGLEGSRAAGTTTLGRWPANVIHDGSDEVLAGFPAKAGAAAPASGPSLRGENTSARGRFNGLSDDEAPAFHGDSGSAARFFYCAKASRSEREAGLRAAGLREAFAPTMGNGIGGKEHDPGTATPKRNTHPTVKPVAVMRWLVRLVTPPGGIVLDPFCGSGTTGVAAVREGFRFCGIEREAEYVEIARARVTHAAAPPE